MTIRTSEPCLSWRRVLGTRVSDLFGPRAAGVYLAAASRPTFGVILLISLLAQASVLIGLRFWDDMLLETWNPAPSSTTSAPTTAATATAFARWTPAVQERSAGQVWADWHREAIGGWFGPAEFIALRVVVLSLLGLLALAWLNLPFVHGTGALRHSFGRSFRASTSVLWPLTLFTLLWGGSLVAIEHSRLSAGSRFAAMPDAALTALLLTCALLVLLLVLWLRAAIRGVEPDSPILLLPPRCEGCGYDLTHVPADGRCPECGLIVEASFVEETSRPGCAWSQRRTPAHWLATFRRVLFEPRAFYRTLKLRPVLADTAGFAAWNYVLLAGGAVVGASLWGVIVCIREGPPSPTFNLFLAAIMALGSICFGVLGCWLGHRAVAAVVFVVWALRGTLPDYRWAARVVIYESAFVWAFCVFWGVMVTTFVAAEDWISQLFGVGGIFRGPPLEFYAVVLGTVVLFIVWLVRYTIAYRAIRWGNF